VKRFGLATILAAFVAFGSMGSPQAAPFNGCAVASVGVGLSTCQYIATGLGTFVSSTTSGWRIKVTHIATGNSETLSQQQHDCGTPFVSTIIEGQVPSEAGDKVELFLTPSCLHRALAPGQTITPPVAPSPVPPGLNPGPVIVPDLRVDAPNYQVGALVSFDGLGTVQ